MWRPLVKIIVRLLTQCVERHWWFLSGSSRVTLQVTVVSNQEYNHANYNNRNGGNYGNDYVPSKLSDFHLFGVSQLYFGWNSHLTSNDG